MIHPSYSELIEAINTNNEDDDESMVLNSRYSLILATSKRARQLIEYARYVENYYGTPKAYVEEQLSAGRDVILEIEIQGARKIKKKFPEAVLVFVTAPSMEELKERLVGRGTETAEVIHQRLARAAQEAEGVDEYDYLLVNDQLEDAVDRLHNIIQSEHFAMRRNLGFIHEIQAQAAKFVEE